MTATKKSKEALQKDLMKLVEDTQELLLSTADAAAKTTKEARGRVEASLKQVQDQIESHVDYAEDTIREQVKIVDNTVRSNPYASIGVSLGFGLLLGLALSRK